tara:strand:- start:3396 stop:4559 length:1164 start_codon:yes stop_codon:yes gene_type:complete
MEKNREIVFVVRDLSLGGIQRVVLELVSAWHKARQNERCHLLVLDSTSVHYDTPQAVSVHFLPNVLNRPLARVVRLCNKVAPYLFNKIVINKNTRIIKNWKQKMEQSMGNKIILVFCGYGSFSNFVPSCIPDSLCVAHNQYDQLLKRRTGLLAGFNAALLKRQLLGTELFGVSSTIQNRISNGLGVAINSLVLRNPINIISIREKAQEPCTYLSEEAGTPFVLYLGRLAPEKNVDKLIQAFMSDGCRNDLRLIIAGDGVEEKKLRAMAGGSSGRIKFIGRVKNPYPLLSKASALALTSSYEGLPTVLLEARALGRFIITTTAGGASAEAVDGYNAKFIIENLRINTIVSALNKVDLSSQYSNHDDLCQYRPERSVGDYAKAISYLGL